MKHFLLFLINLLLLASCISDNKNTNQNFQQPVRLEGKRIFMKEFSLVQVANIDSLIVISTDKDTLFHIYDKNEKYLAGLGVKGRGPGEFMQIPAIEDIEKTKLGFKFLVNDEIRKSLISIDLTASLDSDQLVIENRYTLPNELRGALDFMYGNEDTFIGVYDDRFDKQLDKKRGGFYYNAKTDTFHTFPLNNLEIQPYEMISATNINARMPAISPTGSKVAIIMLHFPQLSILDVGSFATNSYLLDSNPPEVTFDLEAFKKGEVIEYYRYIDVTNNYIYLLYSGNRIKNDAGETRIQVIDWQGNPSNQYLIPAKYKLSMFVVDEKNKQFYGLSYPNDAIYRFDYKAVN